MGKYTFGASMFQILWRTSTLFCLITNNTIIKIMQERHAEGFNKAAVDTHQWIIRVNFG